MTATVTVSAVPSEISPLPRVSVVIPLDAAADRVAMTIASVADQSFRDVEVVLVADAGHDPAALQALLAATGLPHQILLPEGGGRPEARNAGVAAARGTYVAFLDPGDAWLPGKLAAQVEIMDADPGVTLCGCQASWTDRAGVAVAPLFRGLHERMPDGWQRLLWHGYVVPSCVMTRREDLGTAPFDPAMGAAGERELWIKLAHNGTVALVQQDGARLRLAEAGPVPVAVDLIETCTRPMIERIMRMLAAELPLRQRLLARGSLHRELGLLLCRDPVQTARGLRHLVASVALGYSPGEGLREILRRLLGRHDTGSGTRPRCRAS